MMQAPGFQVTRSGDIFLATAPGFRKKEADESRRRDDSHRAMDARHAHDSLAA